MTVDPALVWAFLTALVAGVTRGFSGFGGALIFVPLVSAAYGPRVAAPSLLVIDTLLTLPFVIPALRACVWRQVAPLAVGAVVAVPAGVWVLGRTDPLVLRWGLALLGLGLLALLASGWRHTGRHRLPTTLAVGAVAGFCGGAAQMSGPAVVAYWLGSGQPSALVRANLFGFFALVTLASGTAYAFSGMLTAEVGRLALLLGPAYALGLYAGARAFRGASDRHYRVAAYWVIAAAAVLSLPLFDLLLGR
ncbi:sulfite exporter TauE/SafE family protein [Ancylobacter dichloromethanicus]|uniref:Probable membrane transporter protein n=1 Tax=Ancylobacter dichloromethanicus TaxID=518825 RepID=A0A9W6J703_9HYPH|nr:sulfite exporter TauE/SafE family protein [Ancylobacter dichloromethanicus]MBS7555307.1 sulfite exporter TauE/SafE family protein [Ancylobacter dichloromethanicus]GLK70489.1 membrane protein [Ancylobacter dichloromethanicus]